MNLQEIRDEINRLNQQSLAILEAATTDGRRALTPEENTQFDALHADITALRGTEDRLMAAEAISSRLETSQRQTQATHPTTEQRTTPEQRRVVQIGSRDILDGMRAWLLGGSDVERTSEHERVAQRAGINLDAKQLRIHLPNQAMRSLYPRDVRAWEERALSTLNAGSPVDGFYTIADEMMRPLEESLLAFGGMRQGASVLRTDTGASLPIPTVNDTGNKGEILAENTVVNQQDVAFNQLTLDAYKYSSKMILVSVELLQDNAVNLAAFLGRALGTRIGRITNDHFTTGTGSSQPNGIVTAAGDSTVQFAAQTPTYAELVSTQHSVDPAYRVNARWMFSDSMLAEIKKIVDASTGRPIWAPNMIAGEPDTILGDPYSINQSMAAAAASGAGKSVIYGDISKYLIRDVRQITLLRLDERFADYHQVAFLAFSRHDGDLLDAGTDPVKYAKNPT